MKYDPEKHHRRSIRLQGYDYSRAGAYFITICTYNRECLFGNVVDGKMMPNEFGHISQEYWEKLPNRYPQAELDVFTVMPNHVHGIIVITNVIENVGAIHELPLQDELTDRLHRRRMFIPKIVGWFKMSTAKFINETRGSAGVPVWQRNYWEHVIRDEDSLNRIREYILTNPLRWHLDRQNPNREGEDDFDRWLEEKRRGNS